MNAALVKIDVAAAQLGWSVGKLFDLVDGGTLLEKGFGFVFDLSNDLSSKNGPRGSHRRDLRWWFPEVLARASRDTSRHGKYTFWEIGWVLNQIVPEKRATFHAGEVDQLFQIRARTRIDFGAELNGMPGRGSANFYPREVLVAFLTRRWLENLKKLSPQGRANLPVRPAEQQLRPATEKLSPAKAAPLHVAPLPHPSVDKTLDDHGRGQPQTVSRVGNSRPTGSPAKTLTAK